MEVLGLIGIPGWMLTVICILISLYIYTAYKQSLFQRLGIPGPRPTLFLGTLPELMKKGLFQMDIDNVTKFGKYFGVYIANIPTLMISDPDMIREIAVKQFRNFQDRGQSITVTKFWKLTLNNATGAHWRFLRHTLTPTFSSGKMKKMEPILHKCLDSFVDVLDKTVTKRDVFDIQPVFEALTLDVVCSSAFGIEVNSQQNPEDPFVINVKKVFSFSIGSNPFFILNLLFPESRHILKYFNVFDTKADKYMQEAVRKVIEERKLVASSHNNKDLLQMMIDAHQDSDHYDDTIEGLQNDGEQKRPLTDEEILANSVMFLLAGYETTASALSWLAVCLATNSEVQERLIREIDEDLGGKIPSYDSVFKLQYLDMVLSETLRLYPPAPRVDRQVVQDSVICEKHIPGGISVTFPVCAMHRMPEIWPEPDKFDPERFSPENKETRHKFAYMPFGIGPRNCVGMRLALFEVKLAIVTLLQRYRIEPSEKLQVPPKIGTSFIVKPANGVCVKLTRRSRSLEKGKF